MPDQPQTTEADPRESKTVEDLPALLRYFALADVRPMTEPSPRADVEMAAAAEIERLRNGLAKAESEARRYASHYPLSSDGWNTFLMLADRIAEIAND